MIEGVRPARGPSSITRRTTRRANAPFDTPVDAAEDAAPPIAAGALANLDTLLALQERDDDAAADKGARNHGQEMLATLSGMQVALLRPEGVSLAQLNRLAGLTSDMPFAADVGLRQVAQAIALRARIELIKRGHAP